MKRPSRKLKWLIVFGWLAVNGRFVGQAEVAARLPLTSAMVVQALHIRGVEVNAANVHLPMSLYVAGPSSQLAVVGVDRETADRLRVRLRCVKSSDCVAFTVTLDVDGPVDASLLALGMPGPTSADGSHTKQVAMLHAGDHLALSIQQQHFVLQMPCLAIDTGALGETIRVATMDRRKTFRAVVTGPAAATGVMQ